MKILAIKLRQLGDTAIWTSALQALKQQHPNSEVWALTYDSNLPVLEKHPAIAKTVGLKKKSNIELLKALFGFRKEHFDFLLGFHATTSLCRWAWLAGAKKNVLHHHSWAKTPFWSSTPIKEPGKLENAILRDYQIINAVVGEKIQPVSTHIEITPEEKRIAKNKIGLEKKVFAFLPGAAHHLRRYPKDLWVKQVRNVKSRSDFNAIVLCDPVVSKEWDLPSLCKDLQIPLFDDLSLREFIATLSLCTESLANDSGPGHISVALGIKTHFVFGPGCVGDWHPYDKKQHPLHWVMVDCRNEGPRDQEQFQYCTVDQCSHHNCMRRQNFNL